MVFEISFIFGTYLIFIFVQWIDCVSQLLRMYPSAFEFSSVCIPISNANFPVLLNGWVLYFKFMKKASGSYLPFLD